MADLEKVAKGSEACADGDVFGRGRLIGFCENCHDNIYERDVRFYVDLNERRLLFCHYCVIGVNPDDIDVD